MEKNILTEELINEAREQLDTGRPLDMAVSALFEGMHDVLEEISNNLNVDRYELCDALFEEYNNMFIVHTT
jgi:hydrogenase maturation factor HypE